VASSDAVAPHWRIGLGMVFIDGGHSLNAALTDYRAWAPHLLPGGILAIHDVFPDPADGGQAPFTIWQLATQSGLFEPLGDSRHLERTPASYIVTRHPSGPPVQSNRRCLLALPANICSVIDGGREKQPAGLSMVGQRIHRE
jgi:hypothetical protein